MASQQQKLRVQTLPQVVPLEAVFPLVPLAKNTALGVALMSYNGQLNFGPTADFDALPDVEMLAEELESSIEEIAAAASVPDRRSQRPKAGAVGTSE